MENHGAFVRKNGSFIQRKRWYINLIACLHFFRFFVIFSGSIIVILSSVGSISLEPTFVFSILELVFGILILMKKKFALILYLPGLFFQSLYIFLMWNWIAYNLWQLILFAASPLEGVLCIYLGISWIRSEWVSDPIQANYTD